MAIKKPIAPPINQIIKNVIKCSISIWPVIKYFPIPYNTIPNKPPKAVNKNLLRLLIEFADFFIRKIGCLQQLLFVVILYSKVDGEELYDVFQIEGTTYLVQNRKWELIYQLPIIHIMLIKSRRIALVEKLMLID